MDEEIRASRQMAAEASAQRAADILTYYMAKVWEAAGLGWGGDNESEIREAVDHMVEAARIAATI